MDAWNGLCIALLVIAALIGLVVEALKRHEEDKG